MSNPLDRSLNDMRRDKEMNDVVIDGEVADDELKRLGARLARAYALSGEPPSMAAIDWADSAIDLPNESEAEVKRFNSRLRQRIEEWLEDRTGAPNIGAWIERARRGALVTDAQAASELGLPMLAYRQLEQGRMPVWRTPAREFARFCRAVALDAGLLIQWASVSMMGEPSAAYGRMDIDDQARSDALRRLGEEAEQQSRKEFDEWRHQFIAAYGAPLEGDAPSGQ